MPAPETRISIGSCDILLLGTIAGFVPDAERVRSAIVAHRPEVVALGIPPEDLVALESLWRSESAKEELVEPDLAGEGFLKLLARFGATRIPSPDLEAAYALAKEGNIPVEALDLDDMAHAGEYVKRVKVRHLWWAPRREAKLLKETFDDAGDAYELALRWDKEVNQSKPLRDLEGLRESNMAQRLRALAPSSRRLLAIVPAARLAGIARLLA